MRRRHHLQLEAISTHHRHLLLKESRVTTHHPHHLLKRTWQQPKVQSSTRHTRNTRRPTPLTSKHTQMLGTMSRSTRPLTALTLQPQAAVPIGLKRLPPQARRARQLTSHQVLEKARRHRVGRERGRRIRTPDGTIDGAIVSQGGGRRRTDAIATAPSAVRPPDQASHPLALDEASFCSAVQHSRGVRASARKGNAASLPMERQS
mmetsp:Transcript_17019/g.34433  ORF Transcript_17019/g.34433 Transcript_17019/m.34433 type:complete len:205 (-) Transcript_17019:272-886(-)